MKLEKAINKLQKTEVKNILIIRKHNHAGDMLCSLPLFAALKKYYPHAKITMVISPVFYELNLKEVNPYIDNIVVYKKEGIFKFFKFIKDLRKFNFALGIVPSTVKLSNTSHIINYLTGAKIRTGVNKIDTVKNKLSFLLNLKSDFKWIDLHQIYRNIEIAEMLGFQLTTEELNSIKINHDESSLEFAKEYFYKYFPDKTRKIIGLHTGAGEKFKKWSDDNFISLIKLLYKTYKCYFLLSMGALDKESVNKITSSPLLKGINITVLNNSFKKDAAVFSMTDLFITNNTGVMHIVHFAGTSKMISVTPSLLAKEWAYNSDREKYIASENINDISVKQVFNECCNLLND